MVAIVSNQYLSSFYNGVPTRSTKVINSSKCQLDVSYNNMPSLYDIKEGDEAEEKVELESDFAFAFYPPKPVPAAETHDIESSCSDEDEQKETPTPTTGSISPPFRQLKKDPPTMITNEKAKLATRTSSARVSFAPDDQLAECIVIDRIDYLLEDANDEDDASTTVNDIWYKSDELAELRILEYRHNCQIQSYYGPGHALEPHNLTWRGMEDAQLGEDRMEPIQTYVRSVLQFIDEQELEKGEVVECSQEQGEIPEQTRKPDLRQALADHAISISQKGREMALAQGYIDEWDAEHQEENGLYDQDQAKGTKNHFLAMFCV